MGGGRIVLPQAENKLWFISQLAFGRRLDQNLLLLLSRLNLIVLELSQILFFSPFSTGGSRNTGPTATAVINVA